MKKVSWLTKGEKLDIIGPFGKVDVEVLVVDDDNEEVVLKVFPETQMPSPAALGWDKG